MLRGLYTAATGMATQRSRMDVVTNNIVNAQTTGFKKDDVMSSSFEKVMLDETGDPSVLSTANEVGPYSFGTYVNQAYTDFSDGSPEQTDRNCDLAISGDGFFAVQTPQGERYTRAGNFEVDSQGYLVTSDGYSVLGGNGPIKVGSEDFSVDSEGNVTAGGSRAGTLRIVSFADTGALRKQGDNLYYANGGGTPAAAKGYRILQGYQESSNVDIADEMVDMMTIYRAYEANQKVLSMTDETLGLAVNNLGSLR